jgi:uncharacterized membrane protein
MQRSDLSRWLYTTTGLWLILSPFMIFSQSALSQSEVSKETGILMTFGLLALVVACFSYNRHRAFQTCSVIALGTSLLMSPWFFGFSGNALATWNAGLVGLVIIVAALVKPFRYPLGQSSW